jgi:hypothetical protein
MILRRILCCGSGLAVVLLLAACSQLSLMRDKPDQQPDLPPPDAAAAGQASCPFVMAAESSGNIITFAITNNSQREYAVSPYNFALIVQGTRRVVPYSPQIATVDVPSRLGPGETIMGRAIFNDFPAPEGHKFVFKSGSDATYAVITSKYNPLRTVPRASTQSTPSRTSKSKR